MGGCRANCRGNIIECVYTDLVYVLWRLRSQGMYRALDVNTHGELCGRPHYLAWHGIDIPSLQCHSFKYTFCAWSSRIDTWASLDGYSEHTCSDVLAQMANSALKSSYIMQPRMHLKLRRIILPNHDGAAEWAHFHQALKQICRGQLPSTGMIPSVLPAHSTQNPRFTTTLPIPHRHIFTPSNRPAMWSGGLRHLNLSACRIGIVTRAWGSGSKAIGTDEIQPECL